MHRHTALMDALSAAPCAAPDEWAVGRTYTKCSSVICLAAVLACFIIWALGGETVHAASSLGVTVTSDADCVVAIDDKFVSRVHKGRPEFVPSPSGKHTLSAATTSGDYFEQVVEIKGEPVVSLSISFERVHNEKLALEKRVSDLRTQVSQGQKEVARRKAIVAAVNYYADRWGAELGISENLTQAAADLDMTVSKQAMENAGNNNTVAQLGNEVVEGIEWLHLRHMRAKAHLSGFVAAVASRHMEYLKKALDDPLKYGPDNEELGYLAIIHDVKHKGSVGKLLTAPDRVQYSDSSSRVQIPCSSVHSASGEDELHLAFDDATQKRKTLAVQAAQRIDRQMLLGDVYLACPQLMP